MHNRSTLDGNRWGGGGDSGNRQKNPTSQCWQISIKQATWMSPDRRIKDQAFFSDIFANVSIIVIKTSNTSDDIAMPSPKQLCHDVGCHRCKWLAISITTRNAIASQVTPSNLCRFSFTSFFLYRIVISLCWLDDLRLTEDLTTKFQHQFFYFLASVHDVVKRAGHYREPMTDSTWTSHDKRRTGTSDGPIAQPFWSSRTNFGWNVLSDQSMVDDGIPGHGKTSEWERERENVQKGIFQSGCRR